MLIMESSPSFYCISHPRSITSDSTHAPPETPLRSFIYYQVNPVGRDLSLPLQFIGRAMHPHNLYPRPFNLIISFALHTPTSISTTYHLPSKQACIVVYSSYDALVDQKALYGRSRALHFCSTCIVCIVGGLFLAHAFFVILTNKQASLKGLKGF